MQKTCPQCGTKFVRQVQEAGLIERLLSLAFMSPFRCQLCTHRFLAVQTASLSSETHVDRRQYKRLPLQFPVRLSSRQGEGAGVLTDLSMVGCAVNVEACPEMGTLLCLQLYIPGDERPITVKAAEVRAVGSRRCGLRFVHVEDVEKNRLKKLIESQWERDNF